MASRRLSVRIHSLLNNFCSILQWDGLLHQYSTALQVLDSHSSTMCNTPTTIPILALGTAEEAQESNVYTQHHHQESRKCSAYNGLSGNDLLALIGLGNVHHFWVFSWQKQ